MNKTLQAKKLINKHIDSQRLNRQYRLPAERVLAEQFGYSRATIGKALGVLESEGVILRKKGSGTFIRKQEREKSMTIALVMRNAYHYNDSYFRPIVGEASKYAEKHDIYLQIFDRLPDMFNASPDNNNFLEAIRQKLIDGVLITTRMPLNVVTRISTECPTVSINNIFGDGSEVPCISCDYFRAGFLAGKYLLDKGHRRVVYVTENLAHPETNLDFSGFSAAFEMAGIELSENDILETRQNPDTFNERVVGFFKNSEYTACFVRSTTYALRMISVLKNNGIRIPEDLSVIAAGNYSNSGQGRKGLTVIDNRLDEMSRAGMKTLRDIISGNGNKTQGGIRLLKPSLIEHTSCTTLGECHRHNSR